MYVYCRKNVSVHGFFLEFFVVHDGASLTLPRQILSRFVGRCGAPVAAGTEFVVMLTNSEPGKVGKRTLADIVSGAWISYSDVVPRGGTVPQASYYGVPIAAELFDKLYAQMPLIYASLGLVGPNEPNVVYHGTARDLVKPILQTGLKPTFGMLGTAIYFGSFWKAYRFATLTQDYVKRPGAILRCYAFWPSLTFRTMRSWWPCPCPKCYGKPDNLVDHVASWAKYAPAVMACPESGSSIKNEEWASIDSKYIVIDSVGHAEATTEHHEPLNRSLTVL